MSHPANEPETFEPTYREVRFEYTPLLPEILTHLNASLLVTTYQAGKLLVLGVQDGKMVISFLDYDQPMGLAVSPQRLAVGTRRQMHFLVAAHETLRGQSGYTGCYVPRMSAYTGSIHGHDLAWGREGLWVVNTLFSCLCTLHDQYSFVPRWRPPFISQLADEDRCHLNGLAMVDGMPGFVTAMAETDTAAGWRPTKATSGVVMEVPSGEVVCRGLAMPHSPRVYQDRLWVLNSGYGSIGYVDRGTGRYEAVEGMPGYTRGLAFAGQFAFVGLSRIRETSVFGGIPIAEDRESLRCGIGVIDLVSGKTVAVFQFHSGVSEIFAVEVLPGISNPMIAGASVDKKEQDVWIVPAPTMPPPLPEKAWPLFGGITGEAELAQEGPGLSPAVMLQMGVQLHQQGRLEEAAGFFAEGLAKTPTAAGWVNYGNLQQDRNDQEGAIECYRRATSFDNACIPAWQNLGYLMFNRGQPQEAMECYERLLQLDASPMNQLLQSCVLPVVYDSMEDLQTWRRTQVARLESMVAKGIRVSAADQLVPTAFFWAYQGENDRAVMELRGKLLATVGEKRSKEEGLQAIRARVKGSGGRKLRVGWLSAYFRDHTIGRLNLGRIARLDRRQSEVTVLYAGREEDGMSQRFREGADRFVVVPRSVSAARAGIEALDLDVLIFADVGMDALCSTLAHSRMAPVQVATWGHPDTTGSFCMDYFVSSEWLEGVGSEDHYSEALVRLPNLGTYYERPELVQPLPPRSHWGLAEGRTMYVCPQTLFKFHPEIDDLFRRILEEDEKGEILLIDGRVPAWTASLKRRWVRTLGAVGDRIRFLPPQSHREFMQLLASADVVLDTPHFGGGNSSYEALSVGAPIVTLPGAYLRSRITLALYRKMGWEELVARDASEYVAKAIRLGTDVGYRREVRGLIAGRSGCLFEDAGEVEAWDRWLGSLLG